MECGSVGVLRQVGIAPRDREVGDAQGVADWIFRDDLAGKRNWGRRFCRPFRAGFDMTGFPGLKPRAQSWHPFGMKRTNLSRRPRDF